MAFRMERNDYEPSKALGWENQDDKMKNNTTKLPFKHGYRRQRKADGHPSRRQFEIARRKTRYEREAKEAERVWRKTEERDAVSK